MLIASEPPRRPSDTSVNKIFTNFITTPTRLSRCFRSQHYTSTAAGTSLTQVCEPGLLQLNQELLL